MVRLLFGPLTCHCSTVVHRIGTTATDVIPLMLMVRRAFVVHENKFVVRTGVSLGRINVYLSHARRGRRLTPMSVQRCQHRTTPITLVKCGRESLTGLFRHITSSKHLVLQRRHQRSEARSAGHSSSLSSLHSFDTPWRRCRYRGHQPTHWEHFHPTR